MSRERSATEPSSLAAAGGDIDRAPPSSAPADRHVATAAGVRGILRSPTFSIFAGIVAPIVCFAIQRVLLADDIFWLPGLRFINIFWLFGYGLIGLEMLALALRLAFGTRLGGWNGPVSGVLLVGALFAGGLGLVLLPFSLIGLLMIIGALGFIPFLTAAVYYAHAVEAYRQARQVMAGERLVAAVLLGALLVVGIPGAVQARVSLAVRSAIRDVAAGNPGALAKLRAWYRFAPRDRLVWAYAAEQDQTRKRRLADAYKALTGEDVESRLIRLVD